MKASVFPNSKEVCTYAEKLGRERHLDIHLIHSICKLYEIEHSANDSNDVSGVGRACVQKSLFETHDLAQWRSLQNAVHQCTVMGTIGDRYEEVLKDSIVLARGEVFENTFEVAEAVRLKVLKAGPFHMIYTGKSPDVLFDQLYQALMRFKQVDSVEEVHQLRVHVRRLRSLLYLCNEKGSFYKGLKDVFKLLEEPRKLDVFGQTLKILNVDNKRFMKRRTKAYKHLKNELPDSLKKLDRLSKPHELTFRMISYLEMYLQRIASMDFRSTQQLHGVRIAGKKLKYMIETGMITCEPEDLDAINQLHKAIGRHHDVAENRKLMQCFNIPMTGEMKNHFKKIEKKSLVQIRETVFYLHLRMRV